MNQEDRRVRRTNQSLEKAIFKLIRKKKISDISIKELTEEAMVSRQTFYQHFDSKEDLYVYSLENFFFKLNNRIMQGIVILGEDTIEKKFEIAGKLYTDKEAEIKRYFMIEDKDLIIHGMSKPVEKMLESLGLKVNSGEEGVTTKLLTGLVYMMIKTWLFEKNGKDVKIMTDSMMSIFSILGM